LKKKVGIFDNDAVNPYGQELVNVSDFLGFQTEIFYGQRLALGGCDSNKGSHRSMRRKSEFWQFAVSTLKRDCNIIAWASIRQKVVLIGMAIVFKPNFLYVSHNPVVGRAPTGARGLIEKALIKRCTNVVHGPTLSQRFWEMYKLRPLVAYHPPYISSILSHKAAAGPLLKSGESRSLILIGRRDKNMVFNLSEFIARLLENCKDLSIIVAQRPRFELEIESDRVVNRSSDSPLEEHELYKLLASCDLVASPSSNVTESGTVILANSMALKCVAFDSPELHKHLFPEALAKPNDLDSFVETCLNALNSVDFKSAMWTPQEWLEVASASWSEAISIAIAKKS
jgi:hypothetical protein